MSFTYDSAKTMAEGWMEETLTDDQTLAWGNEFIQRYVKNTLWTEDTEEFEEIEADVWQDLPPHFIRTITDKPVVDLDDNEITGWEIRNQRIKFDDTGTYNVTFVAYPARLTSISEEVELPDIFEYAMAEFFVFRIFNVELDDEDSKKAATEYEARFMNTLKTFYGDMELDSEGDSFQTKMVW